VDGLDVCHPASPCQGRGRRGDEPVRAGLTTGMPQNPHFVVWTKDCEETAKRLEQLGLPGRDVISGPTGFRQVFVKDPDGNMFAYSMIRSARSSTDGATASPSACAVFELIASSNLVGRSTGISPGLAPFKTLSSKRAACLPSSYALVP
jgi:hypothetical protein